MSLRTLPLLYLNLGGEMMYVLDQRLVAQSVTGAKSAKVLDDIASTMFNRKFIEEIFLKHQPLQSRKMLRAMFDKLAHASIMRLNTQSMDKLYDLMVMAVKHQVQMCRNPHDVIMVTLNHLDAIMDYAKSPQVKKNVATAYELLIQSYCPLATVEMQAIRYAILNFLRDAKVKVSIFLQEDLQHQDGSFKFGPATRLYKGVEKPGEIRFFDSDGEIMSRSGFDPGVAFQPAAHVAGYGIHETGNRGTKLGLNMYANSSAANETVMDQGAVAAAAAGPAILPEEPSRAAPQLARPGVADKAGYHVDDSEQLAKEELNLLAKLIGNVPDVSSAGGDTFRLNLVDFDEFSTRPSRHGTGGGSRAGAAAALEAAGTTVQIDLKGRSRKGKRIEEIIGEMSTKDDDDKAGSKDEDLLDLLDQAN